MKKSLLVLLAVLTVSQFASATSVRNARLMFREAPIMSPIPAAQLTSVVVYGDGEVVRYVCEGNKPRECDKQTLGHYTAYQIDRIDRLIERARHGRMIHIAASAMCFVAPSTEDEFTADNGQVLLKRGHFCTSFKINTSLAAKRLVTILENLRDGKFVTE